MIRLLVSLFVATLVAASANVAGTWTGHMKEKLGGGKVGTTSVYLQLQQTGDQITGNAGPDSSHMQNIKEAKIDGDHLRFSAAAHDPQANNTTEWTFDLKQTGNQMEGTGTAIRSDHHTWSVQVTLSREK